jgi:hypothetical protein
MHRPASQTDAHEIPRHGNKILVSHVGERLALTASFQPNFYPQSSLQSGLAAIEKDH